MRYILTLFFTLNLILSLLPNTSFCQRATDNNQLAAFLNQYTEDNLRLFPLGAASIGDYRFNDQLPITFTDSYQEKARQFYERYLHGLKRFHRDKLNANDQISYDILKRNLEIANEGLNYNSNRAPFNQMGGLHIQMGQLGSGTGAQPFKTVKDYEDWITRAKKFNEWADSALMYFRKGITENNVLPKALVIKMIPQLKDLQKNDVTKSVFYGPINKFPATFSEADKTRLAEEYTQLITDHINPAYKKLEVFM